FLRTVQLGPTNVLHAVLPDERQGEKGHKNPYHRKDRDKTHFETVWARRIAVWQEQRCKKEE
ncbi:hypothetical protein QL626_22455, partial [Bacillus subtilis]